MTQLASTYSSRRRKRKKKPSRSGLAYLLMALAAVVVLTAFALNKQSLRHRNAPAPPAPPGDLMAVLVPDHLNEIKADYSGFSLSFNSAHRVPNYVVWELTREKAQGTEPRKSEFHPDPDVYGCPTLADYRNSGFDRGHMAPAADMKWSARAMYDSHVLTNICPQEKSINTGRWNSIEKLERKWALRDSALIIIAGPVLSDELTRTIGKGVSVPERFFKVILAPYADPPRAIAFIVPNSPTQLGVQQLAATVDEVEAITGFDFFSALPDDIENQVESSSNFNLWQRTR